MTLTAITTMQCVILAGAGRVEVVSRPRPRIARPRDVLVRVHATGICGTDRAIALGEFPAETGVLLGHETTGEVVAAGPEAGLSAGEPVVVNPTYYCGECDHCLRGHAEHCERKDGREVGIDCPGTMAEYFVADERFLHRLPAGVPYARAALIEPLGCVLANVEAAAPAWGQRVVVAGGGPIGLLAALVLGVRGHHPWLVERDPYRTALAHRALPAVPVVAALADLPHPPDVVLDTTGLLLTESVAAVAPGGTVVVMGEREGVTATLGARAIATRGIRIVGAGPYPPELFRIAVDLAADLPMERLVTHELALSKAADGFALLGVGGGVYQAGGYQAGKVLLIP
jgi:fructokinase